MSQSRRRMGVCLSAVVLFAVAPVFADGSTAGTSWAKVYTAKVQGVGILPADLEQAAKNQGSVEIISFATDGNPAQATSRTLVDAGQAGIGYPGFSVDLEQAAALANGGGTGGVSVTASGAQIVCSANGIDFLKVTVFALADGKTGMVETAMLNQGTTVAQVFEYLAGQPAPQDLIPVAAEPVVTDEPPVIDEALIGGGSVTGTDDVTFHAELTGVSWGWDTGWWPNKGSGSEPGDYFLQIRLAVGLGADINSTVDGDFILDYLASQLQAGPAAGDLAMDFGAELSARGYLDIGVIDPIFFDIPFIPQFDLRVYDEETFGNWLLDSSATVSDSTGRQHIFTLDLLTLILGGVELPDWIKDNLSGGIALDASLAGSNTLTCESISLSDGNVFTTEGESRPVTVGSEGYHATANYNENLNLTATLVLYPALYVNFLFIHWSSPVLDLPWNVYSGPIGIDFSNSALDYPPILVNLALTKSNPTCGEVVLNPEPNDPCNPQYLLGTTVTLTAVPYPNKSFLQWEIYDPNHPGDANYRVIDANSTLTLLMDGNKEIVAVFKCASGMGTVLPLLAVGLGICAFVSRRLRRG